MQHLRQLVWVLLWLPFSVAGQNPPSTHQGGSQVAHETLSAEDKKKLDDALLAAVDSDERSQIRQGKSLDCPI